MLAMLATSPTRERTRSWLQAHLWGSRGRSQAQQSLRRELITLKQLLGDSLHADADRIRLSPQALTLVPNWPIPNGLFLEGIEIPGEEAFDVWLRNMRRPLISQDVEAPAIVPEMEFDGRPALAIMPITNATGDSELEPLCAGLTEDLIDRISRLRWLPVIARGSVFSIGGDSKDLTSLGARYLLRSSIQRGFGKLRFNARLLEADRGQVLWNNIIQLPNPMNEEMLHEMVFGLTASLEAHVDHQEQRRALSKTPEDLAVTDLIWLGRWHHHRFSPNHLRRAQDLFEKAISHEPKSAEAHLNRAWSILFSVWGKRGNQDEIRRGLSLAKHAIQMEALDSRGQFLAGAAECWLGRTDEAEAHLRHAIFLNPSSFHAFAQLGSVLYLDGRPQEGIEMMAKATRLSPHDQQLFLVLTEIGMAWLMLDNPTEALAFARQALMRRSGYWYAHVVRICALNELGRHDEGLIALADLYDLKCKFTEDFVDWLPFRDRSWNHELRQAIRLKH
jgi:TolB-like protein